MKQLALFDFDGTITTKDTLLDFAAFVKSKAAVYYCLLILSPALLKMRMGKKVKQNPKIKFIQFFFGGLTNEKMSTLGEEYCKTRLPQLLNPNAIRKLAWHREQGHEIAVVSASPEQWLWPWCRDNGYKLICTRLEVKDGNITGNVDGKNCNGREKERRIRAEYNLDEFERIYAYGNSGGDKYMLALAHEQFYCKFE